MWTLNIQGANPKAKRKYNSYKGEVGEIAPNVLNQDFTPEVPFSRFATDVSEFYISAGKLYLSAIIDMATYEVVAFDVSTNTEFCQITRMLAKFEDVINKYNVQGAIVHSDQGWQYQNNEYWVVKGS